MGAAELPVLPTALTGSYPKPVWLRALSRGLKMYENKKRLKLLREAHNDAVALVVKELEDLGIDIPTDGEVRRDPVTEYLVKKIYGFKFYGPVRMWGNHYVMKSVAVDKLRYLGPILVSDYLHLREVARSRIVKVTITGPATATDWSFNEYYSSREELMFDLAKIINRELKNLEEAGAEYVQLNETSLLSAPLDLESCVEAINEAVKGVNIKVGLHIYGYSYERLKPFFDELEVSQLTLGLAGYSFKYLKVLDGINKEVGIGVVDVQAYRVEEPDEIIRAVRKAMRYVHPECIYVNPDSGMRYLPRAVARRKLKSMIDAVISLREELKRRGLTAIPLRRTSTCP